MAMPRHNINCVMLKAMNRKMVSAPDLRLRSTSGVFFLSPFWDALNFKFIYRICHMFRDGFHGRWLGYSVACASPDMAICM